MANTPIARFDTIPRQRLEAGETLNFGVVAFSKDGIDEVEFTITPGAGSYAGTSPITVTSMSLNSQTGVWEYWTPIDCDDFSDDGSFTVGVVVTGTDTATRDLGTLTLYANPDGTLGRAEAWVDSVSGNDGTGVVDDPAHPYKTLNVAIQSAQDDRGGESGGNVIHLEEGTYNDGSATKTWTTTSEWLTIQAASGATKANVILENYDAAWPKWTATYIKIKGLELQSSGNNSPVIGDNVTNSWIDDCNLIGGGRTGTYTCPVKYGTYFTGCYFYDSDYGAGASTIVRDCYFEHLGNDACVNTSLVVNCEGVDLDPEATGNHTDACQYWSLGSYSNRIIYNYKATGCDYQGIFIRNSGTANGLAIVNCMMELTDTSNHISFYLGDPGENFNHVLIWNNTFYDDACCNYDGGELTNSSMVGNIFYEFHTTSADPDPRWAAGNPDGNEAYDNHFYQNVHVNAVYAGSEYSTGAANINTTSTATASNFWQPSASSSLVNRFASKVPVDMHNVERGATSDVGALEYTSGGGGVTTGLVMWFRS